VETADDDGPVERGSPHPVLELTAAQHQSIAELASSIRNPEPGEDEWKVTLTSSVALGGNYNAFINVTTKCGNPNQTLIVDSGNNTVVVPMVQHDYQSGNTYNAIDATYDDKTNTWVINKGSAYTLIEYSAGIQFDSPCMKVHGPLTIGCAASADTSLARTINMDFFVDITSNVYNFGVGVPKTPDIGLPYPPLGCIREQKGWDYVQFHLSGDTQGNYKCEYNADPESDQAESYLLFINSAKKADDPMKGYTVLDTLNTRIMSVKVNSFKFSAQSYTDTPRRWDYTKDFAGETSLAMLDTGGGGLILSDGQYLLGPVRSNTGPPCWNPWVSKDDDAQKWMTTHPEDVRLLNGTFEITLGDEAGGAFTYTVAGGPYMGNMATAGRDMRYTQYCDHGQYNYDNALNIGGLSFLFMDMVLDIKRQKVGLKRRYPREQT